MRKLVIVLAAFGVSCGAAKIAQPGPDYGNEEGTVLAEGKEDSARYPASRVSVAFGTVYTATFTARSQWRAYLFDGRAGLRVNLYADGLAWLDTVAYLYKVSRYTGRPYGVPLATNDDTDQPGWMVQSNTRANPLSSSILGFRLPESRPYALVVTTYRQLYQGRAEVVVKAESEYLRVGLDELVANARTYDGRKVEVRGEPNAPAICTKMACGPSNPCCNRCGARFGLDAPSGDRVDLVDPNDAQNFACSGNECNIEESCRGFPRGQGNGPYLVRGAFRLGEYDAKRIEVDSVRADDCQRGGCSGQLCSNGGPLYSTCEWREWYACFRSATCEAQANGHCGWTQTTELRQCLARYGQ